MHYLALACFFAAALSAPVMLKNAEDRARELLGKMTLEEKIQMLHGTKGGYTGNVAGIDRLSIPAIRMNDGPQGFRNGDPTLFGTATAFPSGLNLAATFDPDSAREFGEAMGLEFKQKGANVLLGPGVNIARVPRGGRNFEYLSGEDPCLGRKLVKPVIQGMQNHVIANVKHFLNNNDETDRNWKSEDVDLRTEWEIYLQPFIGAVDAGVLSAMCSYNKINGTWACENDHTLNKILKGRLGFRGWVMSDWFATHTTELAAMSGLDQQMPGDSFFGKALHDAVIKGDVPEAVVDDKVLRILSAMFEIGLFDAPFGGDIAANVTSDAHNKLARDLAARSTVLLRNENSVLPLDASKIKKIAVIGSQAHDHVIISGHGSGGVKPPYVISGLDGITRRAGAGVEISYHATNLLDGAVRAAKEADVAIVFVATTSTEAVDRVDLSLHWRENELVSAVAKEQKNTIVVVTTPGAILMPWADEVAAILVNFMPGQEAGNSLSQILFGDVNPSAKLPLTMPNIENEMQMTRSQYPGLPVILPNKAEYSEKLLVGYRWYHAKNVSPRFCFGHGLSYTTFSYSDLVVDGLKVQFRVTNTGSRAGTETPQLYVTFPTEAQEPPRQMKNFSPVALAAGESKIVTLDLTLEDLSIWDVTVDNWQHIAGVYIYDIGASSCDIRLTSYVSI